MYKTILFPSFAKDGIPSVLFPALSKVTILTVAVTTLGRNDWVLKNSARVTSTAEVELTSLEQKQSGSLFYCAELDARGHISISFSLLASGGLRAKATNSFWCGDGISFFVVDSESHRNFTQKRQFISPRKSSNKYTKEFSIGQYGSALGYIYMPYGVFAIGFDEWGNFTRACESHDGPSMREGELSWTLCVRGAANSPGSREICSGYKYLTHVNLEPWYNLWTNVVIDLQIDIENRGTLSVSLENTKINKTQIISNLVLPDKFPPKLALGFAASTGAAINNHVIKQVEIMYQFLGEKIRTKMDELSHFHR